jgi:hydrogenase nickel incorporation protein HypA/HybF
MHEWALAESILAASVEAAEKEKLKRITKVTVQLGELQQINKEIFKKALDDLMDTHKNKLLENTKIIINTEETELKCKNCENIWKFSDIKKKLNPDESEAIHFIPEVAFVHSRCPKCNSPDFEIVKGRGVTITQIKGEK